MADILTIADRLRANRIAKIKVIAYVVVYLAAAVVVALDLFVWRT